MTRKRKITKKQYDRAKGIVADYEAQLSLSVVSRSFTVDDLWVLSSTIAVPSLTMDKVDDCYAGEINDKLEEKGYNIRWVSLDDMGHISVSYYGTHGVTITDKHIKDLLDILNED